MRLDVFLKLSRLVPRRSVAKELIDGGRVNVNGTEGKPGRAVNKGDEIEIRYGVRTMAARILEVPKTKQVSKKDAPELYEVLSDEKIETEYPWDSP